MSVAFTVEGPDHERHEANRLAHEVARAYVEKRRTDLKAVGELRDGTRSARYAHFLTTQVELGRNLKDAADAYEQAIREGKG